MDGKPGYHEHRKRLREKFIRTGADGFADYELLELLLTFSIPRKDVKPVAKQLLREFGSVSSVFDADIGQLLRTEGIGIVSSVHIRLVREMCSKYLEEKMVFSDVLSNPKSVYEFARSKIGGKPVEIFMIILVNAKNEVTGYEIIGEGTVDNVAVYPRKIIKTAIDRNASGIVLVHNHPSGHAEPSEQDKKLTREISRTSQTMDLRILDHLIVTRNGYCSFHEEGLL